VTHKVADEQAARSVYISTGWLALSDQWTSKQNTRSRYNSARHCERLTHSSIL